MVYRQIDKRSTFIKKWFQRSVRTDDPFDKFIYAWIAIVIAAQQFRTYSGYNKEDDTDRGKILDYFNANTDKIFQILKRHHYIMEKLASRKGTNYVDPIVDTGNKELRGKFSNLAAYYLKKQPLPEKEIVDAVAELLNKVRNNLFHGVKVYDDRDDIALIELLNPLLVEILQDCESLKKEGIQKESLQRRLTPG